MSTRNFLEDEVLYKTIIPTLFGITTFVVLFFFINYFFNTLNESERNKQLLIDVNNTYQLRSQIENRLNSIIYLTSGLVGYIELHKENLDKQELTKLLSVIYQSTQYVKNFGVAKGTKLEIIYPEKGNEKAIGIDYKTTRNQWPLIHQVIHSKQALLSGKINLIQGGVGVIYRMPIYIDHDYWGILSTVIDVKAFFNSFRDEFLIYNYEYAVKLDGESPLSHSMIWGDSSIFHDTNTVTANIYVPGGTWVIGVKKLNPIERSFVFKNSKSLSVFLSIVISALIYLLVKNKLALMRQAFFDQLTGIPNRNFFENYYNLNISSASYQYSDYLLFIDINRFKQINDTYGHRIGDLVLKHVAANIKKAIDDNELLARWGGDEFILIAHNKSLSGLNALIQRMHIELSSPFQYKGIMINLSISVGYENIDKFHRDFEKIVMLADNKMYKSKLRILDA